IMRWFTLQKWGDKTQRGTWRVQLPGEPISLGGVRMNKLPLFRNLLQIWGVATEQWGEPSTIWDGGTSSERNALRSDQTSCAINVHIKDIKFTNWADSAVVLWGNINVLQENCHLD